jgi:hypothetical protein
MKTITDNAAQLLYDGPPKLMGFGIPFAEGVLRSTEHLQLTLGNQPVACHIDARAHWPDQSIRWCWVQAIVTKTGLLGLHVNNPPDDQLSGADAKSATPSDRSRPTPADTARQSDSHHLSHTINALGHGTPALPTSEQSRVSGQTILCFIPMSGLLETEPPINAALPKTQLTLQIQATLAGHTQPMALTQLRAKHQANCLSEAVTFTGQLQHAEQRLNVSATFERCPVTAGFTLSFRVHNPRAAKHNTGSWDLGDPGSCHLEKLALVWSLPNSKPALSLMTCQSDQGANQDSDGKPRQFYLSSNFTLTQHGSGGEHWQSPIHLTAQRRHPMRARGFTIQHRDAAENADVSSADATAGEIPTDGLRAQPTGMLHLQASDLGQYDRLDISVADFWQNFPAQLIGNEGGLRFELFPSATELQGGESKTWYFSGQLQSGPSIGCSEDSILASIASHLIVGPRVRYNHAYLNASGVFPHLRFSQKPNTLSELIFRGLTGKTNFFEKREQTDVYGWRHYGELYADHEAVNSSPGEYFISHYNNQYDPLMGMTLQYLHWGELNWLALIKPLADHIKDIDIYDTQEDKAEYNGGLFWHTDHYLPAETSSHRSYSRHHTAVYDGYTGGGGPGGQHCYTTGLALHYWLFGDEQAKAKVIQMTNWIRAFYNGNGSLLDRTFRLLTIDFKQNQLTNIGLKAPGFRYPLDRGTGNYLVALLDAYELTADDDYLSEIAGVIRQTVHPGDCITDRNLKDVENAWFYTVFLQALVRYLCLKESYHFIDDDYWYARHSFMTYALWMRERESFYLDNPEKLEFPNDTWCAQEMRKANLFCFAWYFSAEAEPDYLNRAEEFYHYIEKRLTQSPETEYTRILALLMQNDGVRQKFRSRPRSSVPWQEKHYDTQPGYDPKIILAAYFKDIFKLIGQFSPQREALWIKHRLPKLFR